MTVNVQDRGQISLNDVRFPIRGKVSHKLLSRFPEKINTGDYDFSNEMYLSSWTISDQTGGALIEEMDLTKDSKRFFWSTCDASHKGHITLPPLASTATLPTAVTTPPAITDGGLETWASSSDLTNWTETGTVTRESTTKHGGTYSATLTRTGGTAGSITQTLSNWDNSLRGCYYVVQGWAYQTTANNYYLRINDGIATTDSTASTTESAWERVVSARTLNASATKIDVVCRNADTASSVVVYFDDITVPSSTGNVGNFCEFNSEFYYTKGGYLVKMNTSGTHSIIAAFPWAITHLCVSPTNTLLILFGTTDYYSMTTAYAFTLKTNTSQAFKYGIKLNSTTMGAIDNNGNFYYTTTPETIDWSANGSITGITAGTITGLLLAPDAVGEMVVYVVTNSGLWVHDYSNSKFYDTGVTYPAYTLYSGTSSLTGGLGFCYKEGSIYVSSGLDIFKYSPTAGKVENVGLNRDDGLPAWDCGGTSYINCMCAGREYVYFGIYTTGTTTVYGGIFKLNDSGDVFRHWSTLDSATLFNSIITGMFVSSVYTSRLWFYGGISTGNSLYYIAEQGTSLNPKKITGYTYENETVCGGYHITPWFNAGSVSDTKTAVKVEAFCKGTVGSSDTIEVSYRINNSNSTSLATGWTSMDLIGGSGDGVTTTLKFGSSLGVAFKTIQFKFSFVRGSDNTISPDLLSFKFSYLPDVTPRWSYSMQVDCSKGYGPYTARTLEDQLLTVAKNSTATLYKFIMHDGVSDTNEIHYVTMVACEGLVETGSTFNGIYNVTLLEV